MAALAMALVVVSLAAIVFDTMLLRRRQYLQVVGLAIWVVAVVSQREVAIESPGVVAVGNGFEVFEEIFLEVGATVCIAIAVCLASQAKVGAVELVGSHLCGNLEELVERALTAEVGVGYEGEEYFLLLDLIS